MSLLIVLLVVQVMVAVSVTVMAVQWSVRLRRRRGMCVLEKAAGVEHAFHLFLKAEEARKGRDNSVVATAIAWMLVLWVVDLLLGVF